MSVPDGALARRAKRAYEAGRLEAAVGRSLLLLPIVALALFCCSDPARILISGLCLLAAVTFCLWRGQAYGRGVRPGLLAGIVPLAIPLAAQAGGHLCDAGRCLLVPSVCILAGAAGGVALGLLAPRPRDAHGIPLVSASLIAGLAGSVGCLLYGLIGLGGMVLGLLAGAAPVLAARQVR